jgi:hypothetical protein
LAKYTAKDLVIHTDNLALIWQFDEDTIAGWWWNSEREPWKATTLKTKKEREKN